MRVTGTLTTMPDRYFKIVETLESLHRQTYPLDAIYLSLPEKSRRLGIDYPPLPDEIAKLCTVVRCVDYGPITKIVGGLLEENNPETVIITFDDDMIYPEDTVEALVKHHRQFPNSAIGSAGMLLKYPCPACVVHPNERNFLYRIPKISIPVEGRRCDSIYGYSGALYVRKFFPDREFLEEKFLNYSLLDHNVYMNDDILISGHLSLNNIERRIFSGMPEVGFVLSPDGVRIRADNEISYNLDKFFQRMNLAISKAKSLGMYADTEEIYMAETILGVGAIIVISILAIFILIIYLLQSPF
jgi:hypothetical protein